MKPFAIADIKKVWDTYDDFGVRNAAWKPYWKKACAVTSKDKGVYVSTFEKENRLLAIVSNFNQNNLTVTLQLPEKMNRIWEVFDGKKYEAKDGVLTFSPEVSTAYLFEIQQD